MKKTREFQAGGVVDEAELFNEPTDGAALGEGAGEGGDAEETVAGEYEGGEGPEPGLEAGEGEGAGAGEDAPGAGVFDTNDDGLSGIDLFLSDYGVRGGIIKFEDGETAHFSELTPDGQKEVLSSLVTNSVPTIEDKFDLNDNEIMFLNALRESGSDNVEDFVNGIVDHRMDSVISEQAATNLNFGTIEDNDIFLMHLRENHPEFSEADLADELEKATELATYSDTVNVIRDSFIERQEVLKEDLQNKSDGAYWNEIEGQRHEIAGVVEGITNIAGAPVTDDVKEYLLHDMMELNDHNDPILMEKIFADPTTMFKASWFLEYGEDYIQNLNSYWKKEVSKAARAGYEQSVNGMPSNPTVVGGATRFKQNSTSQSDSPVFGQEVSEEDLFK